MATAENRVFKSARLDDVSLGKAAQSADHRTASAGVKIGSLLTGCIPARDGGLSGPVFGSVNRPAPLSVSGIGVVAGIRIGSLRRKSTLMKSNLLYARYE